MVAAKKKRGRQSMISKGLNALGIAIGLAEPIRIAVTHGFSYDTFKVLLRGLTFGLSEGSVDLQAGLQRYTPVGAAVGYGTLKSYLLRKFPIRG